MLEMVEELWDVMFVMEKGRIIGSYTKSDAEGRDLDDLFFAIEQVVRSNESADCILPDAAW